MLLEGSDEHVLGNYVPRLASPIFDTVGTVYHLVIYMQSNKIHKVF